MAIRSKRAEEAHSPITHGDHRPFNCLHDGGGLSGAVSWEPDHRGSERPVSRRRERGSSRHWKRWLIIGCLGWVTSGLTGCTLGTNSCRSLFKTDCVDDFIVGYRNRAMAEKAWHCRRQVICDQRYATEFKDGFIQGYMDVASGGNGCTPAIAPSNYWGWRYQSAGGHQAINAWFQGFPQGVKAAEEDGVGHWQSMRLYGQTAPPPGPYGMGMSADGVDGTGAAPQIDDPFYPAPVDGENISPLPNPDDVDQLDSPDSLGPEPIEAPEGTADPESVFDGLFPPVAVDQGGLVPPAKTDIADRTGDSSGSVDADRLPFRFE